MVKERHAESRRDKRQIVISISKQQLTLLNNQNIEREYPVSTALNGAGEQLNSGCTPRGRHRVRLVIGRDCQRNAVFIGRRATGEIYSDELALQQPQRDWILTRILWLTGEESGFNRGGDCDTLKRYIYIHGTPHREPMGEPLSHGCIRMRNRDIVDLCELAGAGAEVIINE